MTDKELMALVNRYAEACDDLGTGLFEQTEAETTAKHAKATELYRRIQAEVTRLHVELTRAMRVRIMFGDTISNHCIAMQSAVIDADLRTPEAGMVWIRNTLCGPGLLPDVEKAKEMGGAQAWFDAKTAEHEALRKTTPEPEVLAATVGEAPPP